MPILRILIVLLLVVLIGLILFENKKEISNRTALAELEVVQWPVRVVEVQYSTQSDIIEAYGLLQPSRVIKVVPKAQGQLIKIFRDEGDFIKKGEKIAKIDDKLLLTELDLTRATLSQARADLERAKNLSRGEALTAQQLEQARLRLAAEEAKLESINERVSYTEIRSPISGTLSQLYYQEGSMINPSAFCEVVDQTVLEVITKLSGDEILNLSPGQKVEVQVDGANGRVHDGKIISIGVRADQSLKYPVKVEVRNDNKGTLRGGMIATVKFILNAEESLWVPRNAILGSFDDPYVFIARDNSSHLRKISIGKRKRDFLEVKSGIRLGDLLVVSGQTNLREGVQVKVLEQ